MTKMLVKLFIFLLISTFLSSANVFAADKDFFSTEPTTNNGKKWRIGYYEGGEYLNYQQVLTATIRGLMKLGWIETIDIPKQKGEQTKDLWKWLSNSIESDYVEFISDAHYTARWDDNLRNKKKKEILVRLNKQKDVDLIIAMGTWAGKDLANNKHNTATMVLSTSDPISANIIKSVKNSGFDHVHAHVDPDRWERQILLFHDVIGFKKLGLAYEDSISGRSYAAIDVVEKVAKKRGFEIVKCHTQSDISDLQVAENSVKTCFHKLSQKVDAIYVTEQGGVNNNSIPELVHIANNKRIPTFAQYGSEMVKYGFLVSTSTAGYKYVGEFHAETFAKVFNSAQPNEIDQLFEEPPKIAINLKTAEIISYNPSLVILGAADEIFNDIIDPNH